MRDYVRDELGRFAEVPGSGDHKHHSAIPHHNPDHAGHSHSAIPAHHDGNSFNSLGHDHSSVPQHSHLEDHTALDHFVGGHHTAGPQHSSSDERDIAEVAAMLSAQKGTDRTHALLAASKLVESGYTSASVEQNWTKPAVQDAIAGALVDTSVKATIKGFGKRK